MTANRAQKTSGIPAALGFSLLEYHFAVSATDRDLRHEVQRIYGHVASSSSTEHEYSITLDRAGHRYSLDYGDERLLRTRHPSRVIDCLVWHVNQQSVSLSQDRYVLVHAAVAARNGQAMVIPGSSGAGKSTLVAQLVRDGFAYLSDEAAALDPETLEVVPFGKPLSLSTEPTAPHADLVASEARTAGLKSIGPQFHLPPSALRHDALGTLANVKQLIFIRRSASTPARLKPIGSMAALHLLLEHAFEFGADKTSDLRALSRLVGSCRRYVLDYEDLDEASKLLASL